MLLGLDLTSSSWGLLENLPRLDAHVYVDISDETRDAILKPLVDERRDKFDNEDRLADTADERAVKLIVVLDQKERLKYCTASNVADAIAQNDFTMDGELINDHLYIDISFIFIV